MKFRSLVTLLLATSLVTPSIFAGENIDDGDSIFAPIKKHETKIKIGLAVGEGLTFFLNPNKAEQQYNKARLAEKDAEIAALTQQQKDSQIRINMRQHEVVKLKKEVDDAKAILTDELKITEAAKIKGEMDPIRKTLSETITTMTPEQRTAAIKRLETLEAAEKAIAGATVKTAEARNAAINAAKGKYYAFLENSFAPPSTTAAEVKAALKEPSRVGKVFKYGLQFLAWLDLGAKGVCLVVLKQDPGYAPVLEIPVTLAVDIYHAATGTAPSVTPSKNHKSEVKAAPRAEEKEE